MPNQTTPRFRYTGNEWSSHASRWIDLRLSKVMRELTKTTGLKEREEIDDLFQDLSAMLHHAWAIYKTNDRSSSRAQAYHNLLALKNMDDANLLISIEMTDPGTLAEIYAHYPGGWRAMEQSIDVSLLKTAIQDAFEDHEKPSRGRPAGTHYEVYRFLAKELPLIYSRTGNTPSRETKWDTHESKGAFRSFVTAIVSLSPARCRRSGKGGIKGVDYLVQLAMKAYKEQ